MKIRGRKKTKQGVVKKVLDTSLGGGLRLLVHKLKAPGDPKLRLLMERGRVAAEEGDTRQAAEVAREIWRKGRGDKFVGIWCGQMLAKYGQPEEAVEIYCATEGVASSWEAHWQLGRFLLTNRHWDRAVVFLEEAVRIEPRAIDAHLDLVRCLRGLGRPAEAERHREAAKRLDPGARL